MIKKVSLLALVICLVLAFLSPVPVQAGNGPAVLDSSAEAKFPLQLNFNLSAESNVDITDIRLHYQVDRASFAEVTSEVYVEFEPATSVEAEWAWDMRKSGGLPPGSIVEYWWTVEDAGGSRIETEPFQVQFDDTRHLWNSFSEGRVTLYWYEGKQSFAEEIMATAQQVLVRLAEDTGAELERPVAIYIYASSQDLVGAMIYPQEWTGGVAFTRFSTIAIGISPDILSWGKRAMAHELTHLVIHQITFNPYNNLPVWLDEGLAMHSEGEPDPMLLALLAEAIADDSLISVRSLSSPFSAFSDEASLAYAESRSLVDFIIANYGRGRMFELLSIFRQGSSYDGALEKVYGFDMDGLDELWRGYVSAQ